MTETYQGHCLCGAVTFEGRGAPTVGLCHCSMCRSWHGGSALSVEFTDGVALTGGSGHVTWYDSSAWAERGFCSKCGSTLFYRLKGKPDELHCQAGQFDLPDGLSIHEHIFIDEKPDYYDFTGDAARLTGAELMARNRAKRESESE